MRLVIAPAALALCVVALVQTETKAQDGGPETHRYCALSGAGPTVCYYDSFEQCKTAAMGTCIENPGYVGASNEHADVRHAKMPTYSERHVGALNGHPQVRHARMPTHSERHVGALNGHAYVRHARIPTHSEVQ
jgi:Protein of unknown function (DUF3551)